MDDFNQRVNGELRKMKRQDVDLDGIYDLFALRILLHSEGKKGKEDCWRVYSLLSDLYTPIPERFRDFLLKLFKSHLGYHL